VNGHGDTGAVVGAELDPLGDPRWGEFLGRAPGASIFHHPAWLGLLRRQYGYEFTAWCAIDGRGEIVAGLPVARVDSWLTGRRLVAVPFSDTCFPLVEPPAADAAVVLARMIREGQEAAGVPLQVRGPVAALPEAFVAGQFLHHRLQLRDSADETLAAARPAIRRGVAKARREQVVIERATYTAALDAFYRLHLRTRRRQGIPTQPKRFIRSFVELFERDLGFVLLARHHGRVIAAAVFLSFNGTLVYKYGASDERGLAVRPNNLLFFEAIGWSVAHGVRELDFGRTDPGNAGLASFKRGWGCTEEALAYTYLGTEPPGAGHRAERLLHLIIRRTPPTTGRLIGELLYRHTG
jgi:CelD/BcsL family acetyltransferase involved in cellulose biosynthesis